MNHVAAVTEEYQWPQISRVAPAMKMRTLGLSVAVARGLQIVRDLKVKCLGVEPDGDDGRGFFRSIDFQLPIIAFSTDRGRCGRWRLTLGDAVEMDVPADMPG